MKTQPCNVIFISPCRSKEWEYYTADVTSHGNLIVSSVLHDITKSKQNIPGPVVLVTESILFGDRLFVELDRLYGVFGKERGWLAYSAAHTLNPEFDPVWLEHIRRGAGEQLMAQNTKSARTAGFVLAWSHPRHHLARVPYPPFVVQSANNVHNAEWQQWLLVDGAAARAVIDITQFAPCYAIQGKTNTNIQHAVADHNHLVLEHTLFKRDIRADTLVVAQNGTLYKNSLTLWPGSGMKHIRAMSDVLQHVEADKTLVMLHHNDLFTIETLFAFVCMLKYIGMHSNLAITTSDTEVFAYARVFGLPVYMTRGTLHKDVAHVLALNGNALVFTNLDYVLLENVAAVFDSVFGDVFTNGLGTIYFLRGGRGAEWLKAHYAGGGTVRTVCKPRLPLGRCTFDSHLISLLPRGVFAKIRTGPVSKKYTWNEDVSACKRVL